LIQILIESAMQGHTLDYEIARILVSFCGGLSGIPVDRRYADETLREHPVETIGDRYYMAFLQELAW
jgi:hypothetical protein